MKLLRLLLPVLLLPNQALAVTCTDATIPASNPDSIYTSDNTNGTVSDSRTGLMWKKCSEGQSWSGGTCSGSAAGYTWSDALKRTVTDRTANYNDWRLPNYKELRSLVEECRFNPAINDTLFPNTPSSSFWSGSPNASFSSNAWSVSFDYGYANIYDRSYGYYVRLVRAGQSFDNSGPAQPTNYTLTLTKAGTGSGAVSSSPAGINCGSTCSASFTSGSTVTLSATPDSGSTFAGWSGAGCTGTGNCVVTLTAAQSVTATFNPVTYSLTVSASGTGYGNISSSPNGISCYNPEPGKNYLVAPDCSESYTSGTSVILTATPVSGSTFTSWSGGGCTGTGTCTVTMSSAQSVTASFAAQTTTNLLTVSKSSLGGDAASITITSSPTGINCGSTCSYGFNPDTSARLSAPLTSGLSMFAG